MCIRRHHCDGIIECNFAAAEAIDEARAEVMSAMHDGPALA
jgi:hypothetical protein